MPYSLKGRVALVTGGSRGLGVLIAEKYAAEGCHVAINYVQSKDKAEQLAQKLEQQYGCRTAAVQGDVGKKEDCERIVQETVDKLKGLDIIASNAGWTKMTKFGDLNAMGEDEWDKCWAVNCKAHFHLFRKACPIFNANPEGGVFLITASIAGVGAAGSAMPYSITKAASLHLVKCLASTQGPKIRVNAISPGLLLTDWGELFGPEIINATKEKAYLKKETDVEDCADMFIAAAKNSSLTGQNLQIDSGLLMPGRS